MVLAESAQLHHAAVFDRSYALLFHAHAHRDGRKILPLE